MSIRNVIKRIEAEREYNLTDITVEKLFPWARNIATIRKIVRADHDGLNVLKTAITGEGRARDYRIRGESIIRFLQAYGPGLEILAGYKHEKKEKREKVGKEKAVK